MILADARGDAADFIVALALVYTIIIIAHIVLRMAYEFGARIPYSRAMDAFSGFLHDVTEPYLRIFRRVIPPLGPIDLSPMVGILVLQLGAAVLAGAIRG
jgi:uncharacterized protein YggT (Ycf19 family)